MTMDVMPEFGVIKCVYKDVPWDFLRNKKDYDKLNDDHEFVSYFTNWQEEKMNSIWLGTSHTMPNGDYTRWSSQTYDQLCASTFYGGNLTFKTHPVPGRSSDPCVESGFGMWN